jgi:hypothetical protein
VGSVPVAVVTAARGGIGSADPQSQQAQAALRADWKQRVRRLPPAEREAWLKLPEVMASLGATICRQRLESIAADQERIAESMGSGAWVAAWRSTGCVMPAHVDDEGHPISLVEWPVPAAITSARRVRVGSSRDQLYETVLVPAYCPLNLDKPRRRASRMVLSRCGVRYGIPSTDAEPTAGPARRRWTPAIAVDLEDLIDGQSVVEAAVYRHPQSVSAAVILRIGEVGGTPLGGNW